MVAHRGLLTAGWFWPDLVAFISVAKWQKWKGFVATLTVLLFYGYCTGLYKFSCFFSIHVTSCGVELYFKISLFQPPQRVPLIHVINVRTREMRHAPTRKRPVFARRACAAHESFTSGALLGSDRHKRSFSLPFPFHFGPLLRFISKWGK